MKNHFSLRRFGLLFRKHTVEHYKSYLMSLVVLVGAMVLLMSVFMYLTKSPLKIDYQAMFFVFFLLVAGTVFTSTVFTDLGDKRQTIAALTLPASSLEKYLVGWVYSFPIFLLVFILTFYAVVSLLIGMDSRVADGPEYVSLFSEDKKLYLAFLFFAVLHAASLVGAIFFNKGHFIKFAFIGFIAFFLLFTLNNQLLEGMLDQELISSYPFGKVMLQEDNQLFSIAIPSQQEDLFWLVPVVLAIIVWATAYFKLKEKQV